MQLLSQKIFGEIALSSQLFGISSFYVTKMTYPNSSGFFNYCGDV
jgi:hypothetical protein